jgi:SAM-dependent methyltransferase
LSHRPLPGTLFFSSLVFGQKPEYEFCAGFKDFASAQHVANPSVTPRKARSAYAAKLKSEGIAESEIARRLQLLATGTGQLEGDRYNRIYLESQPPFNQEPNHFLMKVVAGRKPGTALDYPMGAGRNAIYLAKPGWKVSGFDQSDVGVAMAQKRARELGLNLDVQAVPDDKYNFGKERFDLILFSWSMPLIDVQTVIDSLKPGGIVVSSVLIWAGVAVSFNRPMLAKGNKWGFSRVISPNGTWVPHGFTSMVRASDGQVACTIK